MIGPPGPLLRRVLDDRAVVAEHVGPAPDVALRPDEAHLVARAVDVRRRDVATGRHLAHRALDELGAAPAPLLRDAHGAPRWPPGVVGSLTHCEGYQAAAVARTRDLRSLGIDAEPNEPLPDEVRAVLGRTPGPVPGACSDRLLFSALEAVYKAWHPLTHRWLDFGDATVELAADGTFAARVLLDPAGRAPTTYDGRWTASADLVVTAVVVPA